MRVKAPGLSDRPAIIADFRSRAEASGARIAMAVTWCDCWAFTAAPDPASNGALKRGASSPLLAAPMRQFRTAKTAL
jgi:hypothetical protein